MRLLSSFRRGRNGRPVRLGALAVLAVLAVLAAVMVHCFCAALYDRNGGGLS